MNLKRVTISNFRSLEHAVMDLELYSSIVGSNNSGKSNPIDAVRLFYNDIKFDASQDRPRFPIQGEDKDTWIEVDFQLNDSEKPNFPAGYKIENNIFSLRKYFHLADANSTFHENTLYGYGVNGALNQVPFPAASAGGNVGNLIYIPAAANFDDHARVSGKSTLRDLITKVLSDIWEHSDSYMKLHNDFEKFFSRINDQESSLNKVQQEINQGMQQWDTSFEFKLDQPAAGEAAGNPLDFKLVDQQLADLSSGGLCMGMQRHLIFLLINLSAKFASKKKAASNDKGFGAEFNLILFEEPEAFLQPPQQANLANNLRKITETSNVQVMLTSHSPQLLTANPVTLYPVMGLAKAVDGQSRLAQLMAARLEKMSQDNTPSANAREDAPPSDLARYLQLMGLGKGSGAGSVLVLLVEGQSEKALVEYVLSLGVVTLPARTVYVLDTFGKANVPKYIALLDTMGIEHRVLLDKDQPAAASNAMIESRKSPRTTRIDYIDPRLEAILGIEQPLQDREKHHLVMQKTVSNDLDPVQLKNFSNLVSAVIN